jgi:hypothetical protein
MNIENREMILESIEIRSDYSDQITNLNNEISNVDNRVTILESIEYQIIQMRYLI